MPRAAALFALPALLAAAALQAWAAEPRDLNQATRADLERVRGIGVALGERLLAARPFADWDDLIARVPGIGPAQAQKMSEAGLRVGGLPYAR